MVLGGDEEMAKDLRGLELGSVEREGSFRVRSSQNLLFCSNPSNMRYKALYISK